MTCKFCEILRRVVTTAGDAPTHDDPFPDEVDVEGTLYQIAQKLVQENLVTRRPAK